MRDMQKCDTSQDICIPKDMAEENQISIKQTVSKQHITLDERLRDFNGEYTFEEVASGKPVGKEIW